MPSLILRGLPDALMAAVKAFANARNLGIRDAAITLLQYGLHTTENRKKGAEAVNASMTPEARAERMRALAVKRWTPP